MCVFRAPLRRTPAQVHSHLMELRPLSVHETPTSPTPRPTHPDPQADNLRDRQAYTHFWERGALTPMRRAKTLSSWACLGPALPCVPSYQLHHTTSNQHTQPQQPQQWHVTLPECYSHHHPQGHPLRTSPNLSEPHRSGTCESRNFLRIRSASIEKVSMVAQSTSWDVLFIIVAWELRY